MKKKKNTRVGERKNKGDTWHTRPLYYVFPLWRKGETEKGVADLLSPSTFRLSVHDRDDIAHKSFRAMHTNARPFLDRTVHESVETNRAGGSSTKPNRTGSWIRRKKSFLSLSLSLRPPSPFPLFSSSLQVGVVSHPCVNSSSDTASRAPRQCNAEKSRLASHLRFLFQPGLLAEKTRHLFSLFFNLSSPPSRQLPRAAVSRASCS